jgi:hypothetical protein
MINHIQQLCPLLCFIYFCFTIILLNTFSPKAMILCVIVQILWSGQMLFAYYAQVPCIAWKKWVFCYRLSWNGCLGWGHEIPITAINVDYTSSWAITGTCLLPRLVKHVMIEPPSETCLIWNITVARRFMRHTMYTWLWHLLPSVIRYTYAAVVNI